MVSVRAQQAAAAATGGAGVGGGVAQRGQTPQSPLQQGSVIGVAVALWAESTVQTQWAMSRPRAAAMSATPCSTRHRTQR